MKFSFFPKKEFIFTSSVTKAEIADAISANVMIPVGFTMGWWSKISDEGAGRRRYFEGVVNEDDFKINYKSYSVSTPSSFKMSFMPQIYGEITETNNGVTIRVVFTNPTPPVILLLFFIPVIIIGTVIVPFSVAGFQIVFIGIFLLCTLVFSSVYYNYRVRKDIEQLRLICQAEK